MLLPEGIRRDNTKLCEEVEIPPSQPMPVGFEEKPVYISDLDEVGAPRDTPEVTAGPNQRCSDPLLQ